MNDAIYEVYDLLRTESAVLYHEATESWMLFAYADVAAAFCDPALSSAARLDDLQREFARVLPSARAQRAIDVFARQLETTDGPEHLRIRRAFGACMQALAIDSLRAEIHRMLDQELLPQGAPLPLDLVAAVAQPLPLRVVLGVLGVAPAAQQLVGDEVAMFLRHLSDPRLDGEVALDRLRREVRDTRAGVLGALAQEPVPLDEDDVVANVVLIVSAGHRTTTSLIGSLLYRLLSDEQALEVLVAAPELIPNAVEEALRCESPIQTLQRKAVAPTTIGGQDIAPGDTVSLVLGAANRDPAIFTAPALFDCRRSPNRHLAFGLGHHFCLGTRLARLQATAVLEHLLPRLPGLRIVEATWASDTAARMLERLIVEPRSA